MRKILPGKTAGKRWLIFVLACAAALALMVPAMAHGHGHGHGGGYCAAGNPSGTTSTGCVPVCEVEGCWITGQHVHDGVTYCGNYHESGYCMENCRTSTTFAMRHYGSCHNGSRHH